MGSDCVPVFLFLLLSTLVVFSVAVAPDVLDTPESAEALADCFFFVPFVETVDAVSFVLEDFRRFTVLGLTA